MNAPTFQSLNEATNPAPATLKATVIACLDRWIRQRPGLEFGNYGDLRAYRAELRNIARDLRRSARETGCTA